MVDDGHYRDSLAQRARIAELEVALRPFARYWEAQRHMGANSPKTGSLFRVENAVTGMREITAEDLKRAHDILDSHNQQLSR